MHTKQKALTLSLIIPVYNEENYLGECLDSIARQTVKPLEVIVVDNNSTDATVQVARGYEFVKVIVEKRQHQSYAQHTGFGLAKGDILGRIDADTILPAGWVKKTVGIFQDDKSIAAVTGSGAAYDIVLQRLGKFIHSRYNHLAGILAGHYLLWGSNCAFKRSFWTKIKNELALRSDIWEDYDLGFCLGKYGKIAVMKDNDVLISYRSIHRSPYQQVKYHARSIRTFSLHRNLPTTAVFGLAWSSILLLSPIVMFDYYILRPIKNISLVRNLLSRLSYLIDV